MTVRAIQKSIPLKRFAIGERIQVTPSNGKSTARYLCSYIGNIPGKSLLVTRPEINGQALAPVTGQVLKANLLIHGDLYSFETSVILVHHEPIGYFHLEFPTVADCVPIRSWLRVSTSLPIVLSKEDAFPDGNKTANAELVDISVGGALIKSPFQIGEKGDRITLIGAFGVGSVEREINIPCVIRQQRQVDDKNKTYHSGVEFLPNEEDDMLYLHIFVLENIITAETIKTS